jgi:IS5 family transposase
MACRCARPTRGWPSAPPQQQRNSKDKLYSLHAPEVVCLAKGKAHKPYKFGAKIALAVTNREGFALATQALPGNPYDGHTLAETVEQIVAMTGIEPERIYADKGIADTTITERNASPCPVNTAV